VELTVLWERASNKQPNNKINKTNVIISREEVKPDGRKE
jgi:hypothetical protein